MDENQKNLMETGSAGGQPADGEANGNDALRKPPKKKKTGFVIAGVILALLLLAGAGVFGLIRRSERQDRDAGEAVVSAFMKAYGRLNLEKAYDCFHPDVRDGVLDEQMEKYMASGITGLERYLDLYFGGMELSYEVDAPRRLTEEQLEDLLSEIDDSYDAGLDISKAYVYQVTEIFTGENGTLKIRDNFLVGKEGEDWYIVAVATDKVIKDSVSFSITDYLTGIIDEFIKQYNDGINERDGGKMEDAYAFIHPEIREAFIGQTLILNASADLWEFAEKRDALYGGISTEYEILEMTYLEEREWNSVLRLIENYFDTEFDFGMRGVWQFDIKETFTGSNGTVVMVENYFLGEEDGEWYIIDINTEQIISNTLGTVNSYSDSEGFASAGEAIDWFLRAYEDFDLTTAFMAYHPALRASALEEACYNEGVGSVNEYEEMIYELFDGNLTVSYDIVQRQYATRDELSALSAAIWGGVEPPANISDACVYLLEEHFAGPAATRDVMELILAGRDGDKWFLYNSTILPENYADMLD